MWILRPFLNSDSIYKKKRLPLKSSWAVGGTLKFKSYSIPAGYILGQVTTRIYRTHLIAANAYLLDYTRCNWKCVSLLVEEETNSKKMSYYSYSIFSATSNLHFLIFLQIQFPLSEVLSYLIPIIPHTVWHSAAHSSW